MKPNVCGIERWLRAAAGTALVMLYIVDILRGGWGIAATITGCILLITALLGYCPVNTMLGLNSCKVKTPEEKEMPAGHNQIYQNPQGNDGYVTRKPDQPLQDNS